MEGKRLEILTVPHPVLKQRAEPVKASAFDDELRELAQNMIFTMHDALGLGLAAPQVGQLQRMVVLAPSLMRDETALPSNLDDVIGEYGEDMVLVNPEVVESGGSIEYEEGCLSVPEIREVVKRPGRATIRFQDLEGNAHELKTDGLLAVAIQHEIDHLNGTVFLDRLSSLKRNMLYKKARKTRQNAAQRSETAM